MKLNDDMTHILRPAGSITPQVIGHLSAILSEWKQNQKS